MLKVAYRNHGFYYGNMYGYEDLKWVARVKAFFGILGLLALIVIVGVIFVQAKIFNTEQAIAISVGVFAGALSICGVFIQIRQSLRKKLETDAISDIQKAAQQFAEAGASAVTFSNDFVVKPLVLPANFWPDKAYEKFDSVAKQVNDIRKGYGALYVALETHEIAIIHLEHLYRYITIKAGDFIDKLEERNSDLLKEGSAHGFDENAYKLAVSKAFGDAMNDWVTLTTYLMDFRKLLQNDLLGKVFLRRLLPRRPLDGSSILQQVATKARVKAMVEARDAEFRK